MSVEEGERGVGGGGTDDSDLIQTVRGEDDGFVECYFGGHFRGSGSGFEIRDSRSVAWGSSFEVEVEVGLDLGRWSE